MALQVPAIGLFHDDGIYTATAKALAEGKGYRLINLPDEPNQTKYPPLFPLLLAVVWKAFPAFPANVIALKLVPLIAAGIWLVLSIRLLRTLGLDRPLACALTLATAASPWVMYLSTTLLSETLFAALCTGALLSLESSDPDTPLNMRRTTMAAVLAALATLTRIAGVALIAGCVAWMISKRRYRTAVAFIAVVIALLLPWIVRVGMSSGSGYYSSDSYKGGHILSSPYAMSQKLTVIGINLLSILASPGAFFDFLPLALALPGTLALLIWGVTRTWRRNHVTFWFFAVYTGLTCLWLGPPYRFIVVVLPIMLWVMVQGISERKYSNIVAGIAIASLAIPATAQLYNNVAIAQSTGVLGIEATQTERWSEVQEVCRWVRENTDDKTVIVGNLDPVYYLLSGRKAIRAFKADLLALFYSNPNSLNPVTTPNDLRKTIGSARSTVVVDSPDYMFAERKYLKAVIQKLEKEGKLTVLHVAGAFRILGVNQ